MARPRTESTEGFGSDSFLDIVCNMVGIIILLVLVVGLRVKEAPITLAAETETPAPAEDASLPPPLIVQALEQRIGQQQAALAGADQGKQELEERLATARQAAATQGEDVRRLKEQGARAQQWQVELQNTLLAKQQQLRDLAAAVQAVPGAKPAKVVQVEAYPAPYIRKVGGNEVHFRLLGERVVQVPLNGLMVKAAQDHRAKVRLSPGSPEIEAEVGPLDGFKASYVARRNNGLIDYLCTLIPLSDRMGETVPEALAPGSLFRRILANNDPNKTTVTFWTYEDSFEAFRELRKEVYLLGYQVANWPMPLGRLIQVGSDGRQSESQ